MSIRLTDEEVKVSPLREARERLGISQTQLSMRTGIHTSTISRLEAGKVYAYPGWRGRLARALETTTDALFGPETS
jgi:transcriptional regulator with XRE-family HTH domain